MKTIGVLDPDWWLSQGKNLLDYRLLSQEQMADRRIAAAVAARPELAAHLGRWLSRVGGSISPEQGMRDTLTEEDLRIAGRKNTVQS